MIDETKTKVIHSQRLAGTLMAKGFVLIGMEKELGNTSGKNVFFFNESPELEKAIGEYLTNRNRR